MPSTSPDSKLGADAAVSHPASITTTWINFAALLIFALTLILLKHFGIKDPGYRMAAVFAAIAVPILLLERLFTTVGLRGKFRADPGPEKIIRVATKLLGIAVSWAAVLLIFWIFPYFRANAGPVYEFLEAVWLPFVILAPVYVWYVDGISENAKEEYYEVGRFVLGQWSSIDRALLLNHVRAWLVKLFFLQFILTALTDRLNGWLDADLQRIFFSNPYAFLDLFIDAMYLVDVAIATVGYILTLRLFDTHVRTTEPTMLGWTVCLICYPPFYNALDGHFILYEGNLRWGEWLSGFPTIKILWAAAITTCIGVYAIATVQLGIRFANLSHRGIVTNGIYGWLKHPAYLSKNASWWLLSIPSLSTASTSNAIRLCLMLLCLNAIYYLRAKTEERHLSWDPVYRDYATWMRLNGFAAQVKYAGEAMAGLIRQSRASPRKK